MMAPCGKPMKAIRFGGAPAGVAAHAVADGFIASSSGSAMVAPTPLRTVRREMCFFDRNMSPLPFKPWLRTTLLPGRRRLGLRHRDPTHPELIASNHCLHQRREPVVRRGGATDDAPDGGHVRVFKSAPGRVGQQPFRE